MLETRVSCVSISLLVFYPQIKDWGRNSCGRGVWSYWCSVVSLVITKGLCLHTLGHYNELPSSLSSFWADETLFFFWTIRILALYTVRLTPSSFFLGMRSTVLSFDDEPIQVLALCMVRLTPFFLRMRSWKWTISFSIVHDEGWRLLSFLPLSQNTQSYYPIKECRPRQLKFLGKPVIDANQELENENFKSITASEQTATNRHPLSDEYHCAIDAVWGQGLIIRS